MRLYKGDDFRLSLSDYAMNFDGSGDAVRISSVMGDTSDAGGTNLTGATKVKFSYAADCETFYEMPVAEATETSASGTCGYTGTLTANNGYLRVVTPGGVSNALACAFNA